VAQGVDLNRNYAWNFGNDNNGSSTDPCSEIYRGPFAFSEPETRAIKNLIDEKHSDIKVALNFHAFGNIFLHPFSTDSHGV
jgi:carboxypeptidase T